MIRLFQFKNNYFSKEQYAITAKFNAIGYFDGLDTRSIKPGSEEERWIMSDPYYILANDEGKSIAEKCDYFNTMGISMVDDDNEFWDDETLPLIFISFVRFKDRVNDLQELIYCLSEQIKSGIEKLPKQIENGKKDSGIDAEIIGYYTFDSSDLIICMKTNSYAIGDKSISRYAGYVKAYDTSIVLQKSFSVCVVKQAVLDGLSVAFDRIVNDKVSCFLRCVVADWGNIEEYQEKLQSALLHSGGNVSSYDVLGSDDIVFFAKDIYIKNLMTLYKTGNLLTHSNEIYKKAFFNVATEILVSRKETAINGSK